MLQISYLNSDVSYLTTDIANSYVDIFAKYMSELSHTSLSSRFPSWQNKKVIFMYLPFFPFFLTNGFSAVPVGSLRRGLWKEFCVKSMRSCSHLYLTPFSSLNPVAVLLY